MTNTNNESNKASSNAGVIAGAVLGSLFIVVVAVVAARKHLGENACGQIEDDYFAEEESLLLGGF